MDKMIHMMINNVMIVAYSIDITLLSHPERVYREEGMPFSLRGLTAYRIYG